MSVSGIWSFQTTDVLTPMLSISTQVDPEPWCHQTPSLSVKNCPLILTPELGRKRELVTPALLPENSPPDSQVLPAREENRNGCSGHTGVSGSPSESWAEAPDPMGRIQPSLRHNQAEPTPHNFHTHIRAQRAILLRKHIVTGIQSLRCVLKQQFTVGNRSE